MTGETPDVRSNQSDPGLSQFSSERLIRFSVPPSPVNTSLTTFSVSLKTHASCNMPENTHVPGQSCHLLKQPPLSQEGWREEEEGKKQLLPSENNCQLWEVKQWTMQVASSPVNIPPHTKMLTRMHKFPPFSLKMPIVWVKSPHWGTCLQTFMCIFSNWAHGTLDKYLVFELTKIYNNNNVCTIAHWTPAEKSFTQGHLLLLGALHWTFFFLSPRIRDSCSCCCCCSVTEKTG